MKRAASLVIAAFVVAWLGAARWSAGVAHDAHDALVSALGTTPGIRISAHDFQPGWFGSAAVVEFELSGAFARRVQQLLIAGGREDARARLGFRLTQEVRHGLAVLWESREKSALAWAAASSQLELDRELQADLMPLTGRVPALWLETRVAPSGAAYSEIAWPGLTFRAPAEKAAVVEGRLEGIEGAFEIAADGAHVQGSVGGAGLALALPGLRFELGDFDLALSLERGAAGWQLMSMASHANHLSWARAGATDADPVPLLSLGGLRADYRAGDAEGGLAFSLDAASENGSLFGVVLEAGTVSLQAEGFGARVGSPLSQLLDSRASFAPIRLRVATGLGPVALDASARLTSQPTGLLGSFAELGGDLRARIPSALAARSGPGGVALVEALRARGWLTEAAGTLVVSARSGGERLSAEDAAQRDEKTASAAAPSAGLQVSPLAGEDAAPVAAAFGPPPAAPAQ